MKKRNSNIELMRIVCILLVVAHHYSVHGGWGELSDVNRNIIRLIGIGGKLGVNCFVLITGYFGVMSTTDTKDKIKRLWCDRVFYSILISIIFIIFGIEQFNCRYLLNAFFPILTCRHNYVTTFIVLYFFIPYINKFIRSLSQKEMFSFLGISTVILSVFPSFLGIFKIWNNGNIYSYITWMIFVYCWGAYIRLYPIKVHWGIISFVCFGCMILITLIVEPNIQFISNGYTVHN